jgi:flagellar motor switch protein FliG
VDKAAQALTGRQKAAIFCINIGAEQSAKVLRHLKDDEIELLTVEVAQAKKVTGELRDDVFQEFVEWCTAEKYIRAGGIPYARDMLERALGARRASEILDRLAPNLRRRPFDSVRNTDPNQLASFMHNEHPQTIAVVMAHLSADQAAVVLTSLAPDRQADVLQRVSKLDRTSPEMLREVERVLERKLTSLGSQETTEAGGVPWAVEVLNRVDRSTERGILEYLSQTDPELVEEISQLMFLFEDIVKLDDNTIQRILRDVDMAKDLPLALKGAKEEVSAKIMSNLSRRAAQNLMETVDLLGPVRIREVEEAQARIVSLIRLLEEKGEIEITRGDGDDEFI